MIIYGKVCATLLFAAGLVTGCFIPQKQFTDKHRDFSLGKGELCEPRPRLDHSVHGDRPGGGKAGFGAHRCGGFEGEAAGHTLRRLWLKRSVPSIKPAWQNNIKRCTSITGIPASSKGMLKQIGELKGVKYVVQLKLASFTQNNRDRFEVFGMRIIETKESRPAAGIADLEHQRRLDRWETVEELSYAQDTVFSGSVPMRTAIEEVLENFVSHLE